MIILHKHIDSVYEIGRDMAAFAMMFPEISKRCMEHRIDVNINYESMIECPISQDGSHGMPPGYLRSTYSRSPTIQHKGSMSASFGYSAWYAFWVHEIPPGSALSTFGMAALLPEKDREGLGKMHTANHRPPQKWKYLEDPVNNNIDLLLEDICNELDNLIFLSKSELKEMYVWGELGANQGFSGYVGAL